MSAEELSSEFCFVEFAAIIAIQGKFRLLRLRQDLHALIAHFSRQGPLVSLQIRSEQFSIRYRLLHPLVCVFQLAFGFRNAMLKKINEIIHRTATPICSLARP